MTDMKQTNRRNFFQDVSAGAAGIALAGILSRLDATAMTSPQIPEHANKKDTSKYGKYIVTELKSSIDEASWTNPEAVRTASKGPGGRVLFLDNDVVPGAFYVETVWSPPVGIIKEPRSVAEPHRHDYDEVLAMFGTDLNHPYELYGEVEFWLGDEKHVLTKTCIIFIPKGLMHCPLIFKRIDKPIFNFTTHHGKMYH
jgi:hypothetical protein